MILPDKAIRKLIVDYKLIEDYIDLETQIQPAGFDLTLGSIEAYEGPGVVDFDNSERVVCDTSIMIPDENGWYELSRGAYKVVYNETTTAPNYIAGLCRTRSSLLRNGAEIETGVWDPGYSGKASSLLIVHNPYGLRLKQNARIAQLVLFDTDAESLYDGIYNKERIEE